MKKRIDQLKKLLSKSINIKTTYLVLLIVISFGLVAIYFSYALFTVSVEKKGVLNVVAANLYASITSDALDENNSITLAPGEKKQFEVTIENINSIDAQFHLYYKAASTDAAVSGTNVKVGIGDCNFGNMDITNNIISKYGSSNNKRTITVVIDNDYYLGVKVEIGVKVGISANSLNSSAGEKYFDLNMTCLPNEPVLTSNMYAFHYSESSDKWLKASTLDGTGYYKGMAWYDYKNQIWANAVTFNSSTTTIPDNMTRSLSGVQTMWVWIPKFEYKINGTYGTHTDGTAGTQANPGAIDIIFLDKDVTTAHSGYRIHPAFTYNGKNLSGIWVAKFMSSDNTGFTQDCTETMGCTWTNFKILPGQISTYNQSLKGMMNMALNISATGLGFTGDNNVHLMKSTEWGAVAYLAQSKYGKYGNSSFAGTEKQIYMNNSQSNTTSALYTTGSSSGSASNTTLTSFGSYSYDGCANSVHPAYGCSSPDITKGGGASTTGNLSGVYDMVTSAGQYVMGNYNSNSGSSSIGDMNWFTSYPYLFDKFTNSFFSRGCDGTVCYGHALTETKGWYNNSTSTVNLTIQNPWLVRGLNGGMFNYDIGNGGVNTKPTRMTIAPNS